jgi:hypothetical protein
MVHTFKLNEAKKTSNYQLLPGIFVLLSQQYHHPHRFQLNGIPTLNVSLGNNTDSARVAHDHHNSILYLYTFREI